ncbi:hypothetical protein EJ110_NYTH00435 [Nymphaea thermarum]|nr:hypothetical protein EJ110_NYTH00435 [Nymphaea thermarum]
MGISFKVSKKGTRFRPKPAPLGTSGGEVSDHSKEGDDPYVPEKRPKTELRASGVNVPNSAQSISSNGSEICPADPEQEVSFSLNLFPNGFSMGTPSEGKPLPLLQDAPKLLYPYNRVSETLFSAIECGFLPGDILDDIPCKYLDGKLLCEVRDYRKCVTTPGNFVSGDGSPIVRRVCLRMSTENVVKDMPSITATSWSYGDLLEVESRIVKALQPELHLDPVPLLDRLSADPAKNKLNLGMSLHRKRTRQSPSVQVLSNNLSHGKKVSIERVGENDKNQLVLPSVDAAIQRPPYNVAAQSLPSPSFRIQSTGQDFSRQAMGAALQPKYQTMINNSKSGHDQASNVTSPNASAINTNFIQGTAQDLQNSYKDPRPSLAKREGQGMQMPSNFETKRPRQEQLGLDGIHPQHAGLQMDYSLLGPDSSWKSALLQQQFENKRNANVTNQKHPQQAENDARQTVQGISKSDVGLPYVDDRGLRYNVKVEQPEVVKLEKQDALMTKDDHSTLGMSPSHTDSLMQPQQQAQQSFMRFSSQSQWHNLGNFIEKDQKKEDASQKRKQAPTSRVSGGTMENSPVSSKSGEMSSGSLGAHYNMNTQKEKASDTATGATSVSSCLTDAGRQQNPMSGKRKQVPLTRTPAVGSPPFNANSPSIGTPPIPPSGPKPDPTFIERFSKLEAVVQRYGLHCKKNKVDEIHERKPLSHSADLIVMHLSAAQNSDDVNNDAMCTKSLSKSLLGGSMNACKTRILDCVRPKQIVHANGMTVVTVRNKLLMSERHKDGMVEAVIQYGNEEESSDLLSCPQDALPTLPNTHYADLFAEQYAKLMTHDGYEVNDQIQTRPGGTPSGSTSSASLGGPAHDMPYQQPVSGHTVPSTGIVAGSVQPMNPLQMPSQNLLPGSRMQHPGVVQPPPSHMQSGYLPSQARQQHLDPTSHLAAVQPPQSPLQQQQHQYSQLQRTALGQNSPLTQLNAVGSPVGNQMVSSSSNLQLQLLQQQHQQQQQQPQQQQQQQSQMRKVMGALPGMGMPNMGSGMVSGPMQPTGATGGLGNFVGLGGIGMGMGHMGPNMSAPMGTISGLSNISQMGLNPASNVSNVISQQMRLNPAQASTMVAKLRMMHQNRGRGMLGPTSMRSPIDSLGGIPGTGPMSVLGQTLNRTSMGSMQRAPMAAMGPPKMPGANFYMNQQQQFQQQQLQLSSPLQQSLVGSVQQQVSSPSGLTVQQQINPQSQLQPQTQSHSQPQQQISPQQLSQQTPLSPPQQLSTGAVQQLVTQQQMNVAGPGTGPASPQLSSQTMGSVGSITSSPMDLQGGSKSNSNINTN